jgi:hypothetical protein
MTSLDRHEYLTPGVTARLLDQFDREAIVAGARGHWPPAHDAMLSHLAIVSGPSTYELCVTPGVLGRSG